MGQVRAWIIWLTGLFAYIVAVLDRTTLGVSGLDAADRFAASPSVLSSFVVLQVVVYACAQVPAGVLLDRYGSRVLIAAGPELVHTEAGSAAHPAHRYLWPARAGAVRGSLPRPADRHHLGDGLHLG